MIKPVYIVGARRSPIAKVKIGNPNTSSISSLQPKDLAAQVLNQLFLESSEPKGVEFFFRLGSAVSKALETTGMFHAPAKYFIEETNWKNAHCTDALLIGEACATGLLAIQAGIKDVTLGNADIVVAGGVDMMSRYPDEKVSRIFLDVSRDQIMATLSDIKANELGLTKEEHENYAFESYRRAKQHINDHELVPIFLNGEDKPVLLVDEGAMREPSLELIQRSRPLPGCKVISSALSSKYGDAAAFLTLVSEDAIRTHRMKPIGKIIGYGRHSEAEPEDFIVAPVVAIKKAVAMAGLSVEDIDFFEINEAFPSTVLAVMSALDIPHEKINVWGGAIAHGHPIGATGAALVVKNLAMLKKYEKRFGVVALCSAIAEGIACVIERI